MSPSRHGVQVPDALVAAHATYAGERGRAWAGALPALVDARLDAWRLRTDGPAACGAVALVVPVLRADGSPAVLKVQPVDDETEGEPTALRAWGGDGAVRLIDHAPATGSMLLERLDARRSLATVADDLAALETLSGLLARLTSAPAPEGMRRLGDIAARMLERVPPALARVADPERRRLLDACAGALAEVRGEPGDRLLHWDLHYDNVLGAHPSDPREPWLAIDPKPLAGDPGFDLLPALHNRWDDVVATASVRRAVLRRFDLMTEVVGLDRGRATAWTLARVLQTALWDLENGDTTAHSVPDVAIAEALLAER
ncbi:hydroxyurea phosphotransferase [Streptomyces radicis]|uniref:Hydroxyurea phosphotransferase n=1 Tax=Streptomyces radicis TaxID=1750517 RepID=A0A3A9W0S5_9ACTN|nr:aminoglycoside phosphotransferase family protein [Streptomyces radicis]RKN06352.1 hydroxyurea phosphotransferase [Streptomyces radicis]RKN18682.1 hydroxyurea phosphotransferase [Streptomyces radicis]